MQQCLLKTVLRNEIVLQRDRQREMDALAAARASKIGHGPTQILIIRT